MVESVIFMQKIILTDYVGTPTRAWERGLPLFALQTEGDIATFWLSDMKRLLMPVHLFLRHGIYLFALQLFRRQCKPQTEVEILKILRRNTASFLNAEKMLIAIW